MSAEFDPDSPDFRTLTDGTFQQVYQLNPESVFNLRVDGKSYTFEGAISLSAWMEPDRYRIELLVTDLSTDFWMVMLFLDPANGFDGAPLTPRTVSSGDIRVHFGSTAFLSNPDSNAQFSAGGPASTASLTVSAIPEPSHAAMLLAGLAVLLFVRRKCLTLAHRAIGRT